MAYEEWFAKQPKVPFGQVDLPESLKADIEEVTKHNPPWMRGQYLSYYRPPVPAHLFDPDYVDDDGAGGRAGRDRAAAAARPSRPCAPASPACSTATPRGCPRSSTSPRRSAPSNGRNGRTIAARSISACCAGRWTAPSSTAPTLNWLGGKEIVRECRAG